MVASAPAFEVVIVVEEIEPVPGIGAAAVLVLEVLLAAVETGVGIASNVNTAGGCNKNFDERSVAQLLAYTHRNHMMKNCFRRKTHNEFHKEWHKIYRIFLFLDIVYHYS